MDINDLRSIFTLLVFSAFIGIVVWAYSSKRKQAFDEAARLAVDDDEPAVKRDDAGQQQN
ncbi:MAG: cbb3-type cytochrome c oxidase subunit 3 [Gammaproteobacteria bacterium]|nr:cbb3-type cytochrome c oxidase subunit 3 [Rhodocyclaceae bacterium]MBU3910400.1 cbb3-type cytochrome c oxidase subunit 3 [Gammaproteobacteria bacterium]MBU3989102.1 cbb3-type cytochrome c oxidase subunit 3 [Gammaproteobacteria bacterium]MBU4004881.1 cbb3-type cytochrome c oxidase subunit 3 [Gammaproteobacteria bacterium]MBU4020474.1 cbb3-type cytochrome c oxidase subunit 3 [Gammaproteobacteria bacterium]